MYCEKGALLICLQNTILSWLSSGCNTAQISFEARLIHEHLPPKLIFAPKCVKMRLASLPYGVVQKTFNISKITC